jgi:hypothetical protein
LRSAQTIVSAKSGPVFQRSGGKPLFGEHGVRLSI